MPIVVAVIRAHFVEFVALQDVAEEPVHAEKLLLRGVVRRLDDAIQPFDELFGRDMLMAIERADVGRQAVVGVVVAVFVEPEEFRVLAALHDGVFRQIEIRAPLRDFRVGGFVARFFMRRNIGAAVVIFYRKNGIVAHSGSSPFLSGIKSPA